MRRLCPVVLDLSAADSVTRALQGIPAAQESLDLLKVAETDAAQAVGWGAHAQRSQQAPSSAQADAGPGHAELWRQAVQHLQEEHEEVSQAGASAKGCLLRAKELGVREATLLFSCRACTNLYVRQTLCTNESI